MACAVGHVANVGSLRGSETIDSTNQPQRGYWVESFLKIIYQNDLPEDKFVECANVLYLHRMKGNDPKPEEILKTKGGKERVIKKAYFEFNKLRETTDLIARAILLETTFMQTLATCQPIRLTPEAQNYVVNSALPNALEACKALELLKIESYNAWLKNFLLGCLTQEVIDPQINLTEGLSEEQVAAYTKERGRIAMSWYTPFKEGKVSVENVAFLAKIFDEYSKSPGYEFIFKAFQAYVALSQTLPPTKTQAFWNAMATSLKSFVDKNTPLPSGK